MDWRETYADKLCTPGEAAQVVKPGDTVVMTYPPTYLCQALFDRRAELADVAIAQTGGFPWGNLVEHDTEGIFRVTDLFAGYPPARQAMWDGRMEFLPMAHWRAYEEPRGWSPEPDVFMATVSPPDRHGYCSFGVAVLFSVTHARRAKTIVAEIHEGPHFIRTGGENRIHVSQIDHMVEGPPAVELPYGTDRTADDIAAVEVICSLVSSELINDGDTLQIGVGTASSSQALYLHDKHDLGIHTEMITGGITDLVEGGVVTGRHKARHTGKVVGTGTVQLGQRELDFIDGNPVFELYDFTYTNDLAHLLAYDNLVSINNALQVDLTGQVNAESVGPRIWSGSGGQTTFTIAASYAPRGRSIIVTTSTRTVDGREVSSIVPVLDPGTAVTNLRTFVDYVVTEHGIATLRGKTLPERIGELISVADPAFRSELREEAERTYGFASRPPTGARS